MEGMEGQEGGLLVTELSHIQELVKQLEVHLEGPSFPGEHCKHLASQILSHTAKSMGMIKSPHFGTRKRPAAADPGLDSPLSGSPSPLSDASDLPFKTNKRRKTMPKWKSQIRINSVGGMEGPIEDGHSWRKYGQKDILGAKHPRGYYRCTHRNSQGCNATKQVQRTDEDPTVFDVTYHGTHTCVQRSGSVSVPGQGARRQDVQSAQAQSLLQSVSSSLTVKTEGLAPEARDGNPMPFSFPPTPASGLTANNMLFSPSTPENYLTQAVPQPLVSPATSDSSHFPVSPCRMAGYGEGEMMYWRSERDMQEVVSALVTVNSAPVPTADTEFMLEQFEFDPDFNLDASIFFS